VPIIRLLQGDAGAFGLNMMLTILQDCSPSGLKEVSFVSRRGKAGEHGDAEPMMLQLPRQTEDARRFSYREAV
jgi:hypothetical protein